MESYMLRNGENVMELNMTAAVVRTFRANDMQVPYADTHNTILAASITRIPLSPGCNTAAVTDLEPSKLLAFPGTNRSHAHLAKPEFSSTDNVK
jgi:hypothetical protein